MRWLFRLNPGFGPAWSCIFMYILFNVQSCGLRCAPSFCPSRIYPRTLWRRLQPVVPCRHDLSHLVTQTTKITELRLPGIVFIHLPPRPDHGCCVATTEQVTCESVGARPSSSSPLCPPRRWLTPGLVLLAAACCWMCVPRTAVPENLPPRALPHRRGPEHSLRRFSPPAKPGAFSARLGSKVSQLCLQPTYNYIEYTANRKLFNFDYNRFLPISGINLVSIRCTITDVHAYICVCVIYWI